MYTILGTKACGSAIVEAAFELGEIPFQIEDVDPWKEGPLQERLRAVNPLLQVPTMILPDGAVMTESAAMILLAAELAPASELAPPPGDALRPAFLRWLVYLVGSVYPTFTYGDVPKRYVSGEEAPKELRKSTDVQREAMYRQLESAAVGPWFLGDRRSAIDLYLWVMVRWRPGRPWFEAHTPKIAALAAALDAEPRLARTRARNFD